MTTRKDKIIQLITKSNSDYNLSTLMNQSDNDIVQLAQSLDIDIHNIHGDEETYITKEWKLINPVMVNIACCNICGSDNVHVRKWTPINNNLGRDDIAEVFWCDDCKSEIDNVIYKDVPKDAKVIGYQVFEQSSNTIHPKIKNPNYVYSLNYAHKLILTSEFNFNTNWVLKAIWSNLIKNPIYIN